MNKNTMIELVEELEKLSDSKAKDQMIEHAKKGSFHDFRSKSDCGKMYFLKCAKWCKGQMIESDCKIIDRLEVEIKNGDYDEPCTVEDRKLIAQELNGPECNLNPKDKEFFAKGMGISKTKDSFGNVSYYVK